LLLSRVLLLLTFVRLLVILLARIVVGVVVGQTHIVVIVGGGGLVVWPSPFFLNCFHKQAWLLIPNILHQCSGPFLHELESFWLAITSGDFILKMIRKSVVRTMSEWSITPIAMGC
jgi:hypothetical protein